MSLTEIAAALDDARRNRVPVALATLVGLSGSLYRRPAARLVLAAAPDEGPIRALGGAISGGCLENDLAERAQEVLSGGAPRLVRYDLTKDADALFGFGLGCEGVADVFLERLDPDASWLSELRTRLAARAATCAATILASPDGARPPGARLLSPDAERLAAALGLDAEALGLLATARGAGRLTLGSGLDVFVERVDPPPALWVFGAGDDARPLASQAKALGWWVGVADHRPAFATTERFPAADRVALLESEPIPPDATFDARTAAVVMSHRFEKDGATLSALARTDAAYVGLLGPRRRAERLLSALEAADRDRLAARLFAPVGLDLGAESPAEIALSAVAEIQAAFAGRRGGFLRERRGPIHEAGSDSAEPRPIEAPAVARA